MSHRGHRVADRQRGELLAMAGEEWIAADHQATRAQLNKLYEDFIQITFGAGTKYFKLQPEGAGRRPQVCRCGFRQSGTGWVDQQCHDACSGLNSCSNSSRLGDTSTPATVTPVMLLPGRFRLTTRPSLTGSSETAKTIGIVVVSRCRKLARDQ